MTIATLYLQEKGNMVQLVINFALISSIFANIHKKLRNLMSYIDGSLYNCLQREKSIEDIEVKE